MTHKRRIGRMVSVMAGLVLLTTGGCSNESGPSVADGPTMVVPRPGAIAAVVNNQTATLDIVGVQTGIPMHVNDDGSVTVTVSQVPVGTWTFRITYFGGSPSVKILEATGPGTVQANIPNSVSLTTLNQNFDDDHDGVTNLQEVNAGFNALDQLATPTLITAMVAGGLHSLVLKNDGNDGTVWAWGSDSSGQLGNDTAIENMPMPVQVVRIPTQAGQ